MDTINNAYADEKHIIELENEVNKYYKNFYGKELKNCYMPKNKDGFYEVLLDIGAFIVIIIIHWKV